MNEKSSKIIEKLNDIVGSAMVTALKNGTLRVIPFTILGSVFILMAYFPLSNWSEIMSGIFGADWQYPLNQVISSTFDIMALVIAVSVAYEYAVIKKREPLSCAFIAMVCFFISVPNSVVKDGVEIGSVLPKGWIGGPGSFAAIIISLVVASLYCAILDKGWTIKMPESVPQGVINSFTALVPGFICIVLAFVVCIISKVLFNESFTELVFKILQIPLQLAFGTLPGAIFISVLISVFWMLGIHSSVVGGITDPILRANSYANQALLDSGVALTAGSGAYLVTYQMSRHFMQMTGSGLTIGLVLAMLFAAKSKRYKMLGKMAIAPSLFNVNEPVIFGFPIVFNFKMAIPFIGAPILGLLTAYLATAIGFLTPYAGFDVPWSTPPLISGFLIGGWKAVVVQIIVIIESCLIYYPFFKKIDRAAYLAEKSEE